MNGSLATVLREACGAHAGRVALRGEGCALSYQQVLEHAQALAASLHEAGLSESDPVIVKVSNHPFDFAALLGVWLAAGVAVPVHRTAPPGVVEAIQSKARSRLVVDLDRDAGSSLDVRVLDAPLLAPADRKMLKDAALVIFTSGSTGLPKGVVLTHQAFAGKLEQNQRIFGITASDACLLVLNNTFSFGIWMALLTLSHGGLVVTRSRFSPQEFIDTLVEEGISITGVVPTMIRATFGALTSPQLADGRQRLAASARLRTMVIGGEPLGTDLSAQLRSFIHPAGLYDVYGLTETSTSDFVLPPDDSKAHPGSIGQPAGGVVYRIMRDDGQECAVGEPGELQLRSPYLMAGYLGDQDLTEAAFVDGWFRTGDLAARDDEGYVGIVGRLKELVVRGGNKITPREVELALAACPGVASAMVAGVPDPVLGQRIHALLVPKAGEVIDASAIRKSLAGSLEKFKHPDACYVAAELPTGRTGKLERAQLARLVADGAVEPLAAWSA
jgi:long-chain acyl-CoA synthetase